MNSRRLYRQRSLTDNVNLVFDFVGENWRLWFKLMIYFLLPFSVVLGTTFATLYRDDTTSMSGMMAVVSIVLLVVGCAVVTALQILLVKWYEDHDCTLDGCSAGEMWRALPWASFKCLVVIVLCIPLMALAVVAMLIPIPGLVVSFAVLPMFLLCPIMLIESKMPVTELIRRAFSLGYKKWGALILIAVVMGIVAVLLNNAVTFPLGIFMILESLFEGWTIDSALYSLGSDIILYVMCVAESFMIFVEIGLFVLAMTYHYGHVAAEVEDIGLESDIDNFAYLK